MKVLDLCAGTHSLRKALPSSFVVTSVDISDRYHPTIHADIRTWDYKNAFPVGYFDIIWASPPCTQYSVAKTIGVRDYAQADAIVKRCLDIIQYFRPWRWFVENPGGGARLHTRPFMRSWERYKHSCCYCRYGYNYRKVTNIWTNRPNTQLKMCNIKTPCATFAAYKRHFHTAQCSYTNAGNRGTGKLGNRYSVPPKLIRYLIVK
jgi:hypothetical protein